jgi:hypothetical protein
VQSRSYPDAGTTTSAELRAGARPRQTESPSKPGKKKTRRPLGIQRYRHRAHSPRQVLRTRSLSPIRSTRWPPETAGRPRAASPRSGAGAGLRGRSGGASDPAGRLDRPSTSLSRGLIARVAMRSKRTRTPCPPRTASCLEAPRDSPISPLTRQPTPLELALFPRPVRRSGLGEDSRLQQVAQRACGHLGWSRLVFITGLAICLGAVRSTLCAR